MLKQERQSRLKATDVPSDGIRGRFELSRVRHAILIFAILLSNFSLTLDSCLAASAHVAIASAFKKTNLSNWPVNAFHITAIAFQPLYAPFSNHLGRRIPYLVASSFFAIGLVLSANASSWIGLVAARALCGLGDGGIATMGSVLATDIVGLENIGYYQSVNYIVCGLGAAIGSASGGALVQNFGWCWVFKAEIPITLLALLLLTLSVPSQKSANDENQIHIAGVPASSSIKNFDWLGSLCLTGCLTSMFCFLSIGGSLYSWSHPIVIFAGLCFASFLGVLIRTESIAVNPILPPVIFHQFPSRNVMFASFLFPMIHHLVMYNMPMFFQTVLLESPEVAGVHIVVPSITFTIVSALTASLISRSKTPAPTLYASQIVLIIGATGLVVMAAVFPKIHVASWIYNLMLILPAAGSSMLAPSALLTLLNLTDPDTHAVVNGGFVMVRLLGIFMAITLSTTVVQGSIRASFALDDFDAPTQKKIDAIRKNIDLISGIGMPIRSQVIDAFRKAYTALFILCIFSTVLIVISLFHVQPGTLSSSFTSADGNDEPAEFELAEG